MKQFLLIFAVSLCLAGSVFGQIETTIADVQDTTGGPGGGDSHLLDSTVTVVGVVSGEIWAYGSVYYIQDGTGPWSGVMVYDWGRENAYGDSVRITAVVDEYSGMTELVDVSAYEVLATGATVEPTLVTTGEIGTDGANAEAYEGVLVQVRNVTITNPDLGYGEWEVDDDSGPVRVDDAADYYFTQANYDSVRSITGPLNYAYGDTKIEPRLAWDIVEAGMPSGTFGNPIVQFTRIQRIQQVRYSDLLKTPIDEMSDMSYAADSLNGANNYAGDTLHIRGVVTYPTDLGSAGAGRKMILSEIGGGPWSAVLSYHPDAGLFPALYEGDIVEFYGYVGEYRRGPSNMTEFWILTLPVVTDFDQPLPADTVNTGDLRWPVTAEQWGNVMVVVKDAVVTDLEPAYTMFKVDDGTGSVEINADSDSLAGYPDPPLGSIASSIRGWMYHHYGLYTDSTTYNMNPPYPSDIVWGGGGPPIISDVMRDIVSPTPDDAVTISMGVATSLTLTDVSIHYRVNSGEYTTVPMTNTSGETYEGEIPAQPMDSFVDFFVAATDEKAQVTSVPMDTSVQNLCYPVTDGSLSIMDIQYTPWERADSPFDGYSVEVTGIVNTDTASNNNFYAYGLQDAGSPWNGLFLFGIDADLNRGDEITVQGTVTEYNPDWESKWGNNTVILVDSYELKSTGKAVSPMTLTTGELADSSAVAESYEGTVVTVTNVTLESVNSYDVSFNDGSGQCLVDDDFLASHHFAVDYPDGEFLYAFGDTIWPGEVVDAIRGVFTYSFGTFKISVRGVYDFGTAVGINPDYKAVPLSYKLNQNYPNPFNPTTNIHFEIPQQHDIKIVIYNMLGQIVRRLTDETFRAGRHVVKWDGQSDFGFQVPSGMYIYRIKAGEFMDAKKMVLIK